MRRPAVLAVVGVVFGASVVGQRRDGSSQAVSGPEVVFEDVAREAGLDFEHVSGASPEKFLEETMGSGGLFLDFDGDGWLDVFLVDGGSLADPDVAGRARHRLLRNRGNGTFDDVTRASRLEHSAYGMGACAADYDNDGRIDLYVTNAGPNVLFHNDGKGRFRDVTGRARVGSPLWSASCVFVDVDRDGDLDLFVTNYLEAGVQYTRFCGDARRRIRTYCHPFNYKGLPNVLYRNDGDGTFADVTAEAGLAGYIGNGLGVVAGDYDDDGWPDVFVANDSVPNFLFRNKGGGTFEEVALAAGVAVAADGKARAGMGTDLGDYDGDGRLDIVVTNHEFETQSLFRNLGRGLFANAAAEAGIGLPTLPLVGFGAVFFDYDNDGPLDLAFVNGHVIDNTAMMRPGSKHAQPRQLFRNTGGRFVDVSPRAGPVFAAERVGRALVAGDVDNDGDLDLLVTNNGQRAELLRNVGGNRNNALLVRLVGTTSNRDGVGARVKLTVGSQAAVREVKAGSSYLGQNDLRVHFGLGQAARADSLEIRWPSGRTDVVRALDANSVVTVVEGKGVTQREPFYGANQAESASAQKTDR